MISYEFYVNSFMGTALGQKAFYRFARRAQEALDRLTRHCKVGGTTVERAMAICAMAEVLQAWQSRGPGVKGESVGGVTVQYRDDCSLQRELYRTACVYLDICRAVG